MSAAFATHSDVQSSLVPPPSAESIILQTMSNLSFMSPLASEAPSQLDMKALQLLSAIWKAFGSLQDS